MTITNFAFLLVAVAVACYVASYIINSIRLHTPKFDYDAAFKRLTDSLHTESGDYIVTKEWYDGHKSSEVVENTSAAAAFKSQSDKRRNLGYYIKSVEKV